MHTPSRLVDQYDLVLLDLMDTLMFGGNRFSDPQDYAQTYRQLGGTYHLDDDVQRVIEHTYHTMNTHYGDPAYYESFRPAPVYIADSLTDLDLPQVDLDCLHDVFAYHEMGRIPDGHCRALRTLATTHRLGLVSNLWSEKTPFVEAFRANGILHLFDSLVFSSDYSIIKPSPKLFEISLRELSADPARTLFVGDSLERDILGAEALGMATVLVTGTTESTHAGLVVRDLPALLRL
ncbi:HAD family hydrolase [Fibrella aquatilis]|uniref:HAD family hydrolase n=1 Tax=Fibrella aquatilis TaxID=2817059 RepID=A0A939K1P6_9BACT|nr:HAD family hydrolase [Fibrella aquatilis]MBO0933281.1 HAD family hydrolase [Fibrella aquatilis]